MTLLFTVCTGDGGLRTASGQLLTDLETALQQQQQQADIVSPVAPSAVTPLSPLTPTAEAAPQTSNGDARLQQTAMWQLGQQQKQEDGDSNVGAAGGAAAPHKLLEQFIDSNTAFSKFKTIIVLMATLIMQHFLS